MNQQILAWLVLAASVFAEVLGTFALRYAEGFTRPLPSAAVVICYGSAIWLMSLSIKHLEMGLTYAVWAGCGTALTAALGIIWFDESSGPLRLAGLGCIVLGVIALNLSSH
ncbi:DMT family transporter [Paracidovorax wautersii]|uniref:Small multidrug resistance pump n=1 Tax=Paracidovorax wautersii TaxID=1177982 RepID=A0A1I2AGQ2_9BURK|nr:multidrug efflux SMR transporter [Paracidovorax wautersii]SFE43062.1 small multidrug resistance pump [Paracidovorax wautersii]